MAEITRLAAHVPQEQLDEKAAEDFGLVGRAERPRRHNIVRPLLLEVVALEGDVQHAGPEIARQELPTFLRNRGGIHEVLQLQRQDPTRLRENEEQRHFRPMDRTFEMRDTQSGWHVQPNCGCETIAYVRPTGSRCGFSPTRVVRPFALLDETK